jgi:photosystem II stability/assembly factor-like uncharacterized protein
MKPIKSKFLISVITLCLVTLASAQTERWRPVGPEGGDVRSLSYDPSNPDRIVLGTSAGQLYVSVDQGASWARWARIGAGNDFVLDNVIFDPQSPGTIYIAAWTVEREGGGVYRTLDNGKTWTSLKGMEGKSVRAMALSANNHKVLVAGALDGVYRSNDGGDSWERISPSGHAELKNFESIAVDPVDPNVVYAGTWHLAWKTSDGGRNWHQIKNGVIDDSDVFSIIIDPRNPQVVYASACSGIYKSENGGELFHKVQGIPFSARRTRVLQQDPVNSSVVYAGTTEGLWKTSDAGKSWRRMTGTNVIVNDVLVDPRKSQHVLLATDRSGVLASENSAETFIAANAGFAHRQVTSIEPDGSDARVMYTSVINDKEYGGVFMTRDAGEHWAQISGGLDGRDVFVLRKAGTALLAGTNRGVFAYERVDGKSAWRPMNHVMNVKEIVVRKATKKTKAVTRKEIKTGEISARVADLAITPERWFAAGSSGLYISSDHGKSWHGGAVKSQVEFSLVRVSPEMVAAGGHRSLMISVDGGENWTESKLPEVITSIVDVAFGPQNSVYVAAREGAYRSSDGGETWSRVASLPVVNLASMTYDESANRLLVTSTVSTDLFASYDNARSWKRISSGWLLRSALPMNGHMWSSTAFDGIVVWDGDTASVVAAASAGSNSVQHGSGPQ